MKRLLAILLLICANPALAQVRGIPADAKRGEIRHLQGMTVEIDGETRRLAPGAQIRDASNRIVVPASLPERAPVKYRVDAQGLVSRVWILTPQEAAQPDKPR